MNGTAHIEIDSFERMIVENRHGLANLFSVAPDDFDAGMPAVRTPPSRPGFPETHSLLNQAWRNYLAAMVRTTQLQV